MGQLGELELGERELMPQPFLIHLRGEFIMKRNGVLGQAPRQFAAKFTREPGGLGAIILSHFIHTRNAVI